MNILLFNSNFNEKNLNSWITFIDNFKEKNKLFVITESELSNNLISSKVKEIKCNSINFESNKIKIKKLDKKNLYKKYKHTSLFEERLSVANSYYSVLNKSDKKFEDDLSSHIIYFEKYLKLNKIDLVFMCVISAYESYTYTILEKVSNIMGIKIIIYQHPLLRSFVYDNQLRFSNKIYKDYKRFLNKGLEKREIKKSKIAIKSYKKFVTSDNYNEYIYRKSNKLNKFKKYLFNFGNKKNINSNKVADINFIKVYKNKIEILLINKKNNYRNFKFSPHYSLPEAIRVLLYLCHLNINL